MASNAMDLVDGDKRQIRPGVVEVPPCPSNLTTDAGSRLADIAEATSKLGELRRALEDVEVQRSELLSQVTQMREKITAALNDCRDMVAAATTDTERELDPDKFNAP